MSMRYDVIVIGAGIGGLTAAAILSRNGKKVLVLEKNPVAGGYAINFRRGKFEFDASLHMICGCNKEGQTYKILEESGIINKVQFAKPKYLYRMSFPDFDMRVVQGNPSAYISDLIKAFPHETKGIYGLVNEIQKIYTQLSEFMSFPKPFVVERLYFRAKYPLLFYYTDKSWQDLLNRFLKDNSLKVILSQLWEYLGLPPSQLSCLNFAYAWHDYLYNGGFYPLGGSQTLATAFIEVIKENAGTVLLNAEVGKIIVKKRTVEGVQTKKKEEFYADTIISGIDVNQAFLQLMPKDCIPGKYRKKLVAMQPSISAFQVYLGLNIDPNNIGLPDYEIFDNPGYDLDKQYVAIERNDMENAPCVVTIYSNIENNVSGIGRSIVGIISLAGYDFWKNITAKDKYRETKKTLADILIKRAQKFVPNLSSYIETIEIATPLTMERYTGNYKGAIYGWSQVISQSGLDRLRAQTPIKNLYLSGAWTRPGGGMAAVMLSGKQIADRLLKRTRIWKH